MRGILVAVGAVLALTGCGSNDPRIPATTTRTTSPTPTPTSTLAGGGWGTPPTTTTQRRPTPTLSSDELKDAQYIATLIQQDVPIDDRDQLILMGHTVCVYLGQGGTSLIDAAAGLMDEYGYPNGQAGDIAVSAVDVYCPENGQ